MLRPLRGWWYAGPPAVAPVRDALSDDLKIQLYHDPRQALHIALPQELDSLSTRWQTWTRERVLVQEPVSAFYAYSQTFHLTGFAGPFTRWGVIGLLPASAPIYPHEKTLTDREAEIIAALRALPVQATPVHLLADGAWERVYPILRDALVCPRFSVAGPDGVMHRLTPIQHARHLQLIQEAFQGATLYIADGHHRWQAVQKAGLSCLLAFLTDKADPTLRVPSAHRLLWTQADVRACCEAHFEIRPAGACIPLWQEVTGLRHTIGMIDLQGRAWTLRLRPARWEISDKKPLISWVHEWIIDPLLQKGARIEFGREWSSLIQKARTEKAWLLAMPSLTLSEVLGAATARQPLPPKATYFFPKVLSGLVYYEEGQKA